MPESTIAIVAPRPVPPASKAGRALSATSHAEARNSLSSNTPVGGGAGAGAGAGAGDGAGALPDEPPPLPPPPPQAASVTASRQLASGPMVLSDLTAVLAPDREPAA